MTPSKKLIIRISNKHPLISQEKVEACWGNKSGSKNLLFLRKPLLEQKNKFTNEALIGSDDWDNKVHSLWSKPYLVKLNADGNLRQDDFSNKALNLKTNMKYYSISVFTFECAKICLFCDRHTHTHQPSVPVLSFLQHRLKHRYNPWQKISRQNRITGLGCKTSGKPGLWFF